MLSARPEWLVGHEGSGLVILHIAHPVGSLLACRLDCERMYSLNQELDMVAWHAMRTMRNED